MLLYFAAPLFNIAERHFNEALTHQIEALGIRVFLPQRDGLEVRPPEMTREEKRRAMFERDYEQILSAPLFLFVLDGRVPDEGACVELGIAYAHKRQAKAPKLLLGLHTDARAAFLRAKLNPMLALAFDQIYESQEELLSSLSVLLLRGISSPIE